MIEVVGKYNKANIRINEVDTNTYEQVLEMCNLPQLEGTQIEIMPDCHSGAGCVIGTTIQFDKGTPINPLYVGVDIGCSVLTAELPKEFTRDTINLKDLDNFIDWHIPYGFNVRDEEDSLTWSYLGKLECIGQLDNLPRLACSAGTLGGGNHYVEVSENSKGTLHLHIHTGSRNLGHQVATHYSGLTDNNFLTGELSDMYLHDMQICQEFAHLNRIKIFTDIFNLSFYTPPIVPTITTQHNYIEKVGDSYTLRKGAVSAKAGEQLIIPMNMRDGSLLCVGKGNPDWNYSAPHGAGRVLSRSQAKKKLSMEVFTEQMKDVYTSRVSEGTLDESPDAYKDMSKIIDCIVDTVDIVDVLKPIYNFKA